MTDVTRKLAAILAADVAGYQVPAMLAMGHERTLAPTHWHV